MLAVAAPASWHIIALSIAVNGLAQAALRSVAASDSELATPGVRLRQIAVAAR